MAKESTKSIANLLRPKEGNSAPVDRRSWSIPIAGVWVPFFMATNANGESNIPSEVLGAPLRLAKEKDGTPKFSSTGRPVVRVVKELSDQVRIVRDNFVFGLQSYTASVAKAKADQYKAQVEAAHKMGTPINEKAATDLQSYLDGLNAEGNGTSTHGVEKTRELVTA